MRMKGSALGPSVHVRFSWDVVVMGFFRNRDNWQAEWTDGMWDPKVWVLKWRAVQQLPFIPHVQ